MIINLKLKNAQIIGYKTFPISLSEPYVEVEQLPKDILSGKYRVVDHKLVACSSSFVYDKESALTALKRYKNDVINGVIEEDEQQHQEIVDWVYNGNFNNPPSVLLTYLEASNEY